MILRVIIDNLYSFNRTMEFNMFTNKSQRHLEHKRHIGKIAYLKMAAIYGANGAGKSNMIKVLELLKKMVIGGTVFSYLDNLKFKLDNECQERCSSIAVEFVVKDMSIFILYRLIALEFTMSLFLKHWHLMKIDLFLNENMRMAKKIFLSIKVIVMIPRINCLWRCLQINSWEEGTCS